MGTISCRRPLPLRFSCQRVAITTAVGVYLACISFLPDAVHALDPDKQLTQYMHTSWRIQDGSAPDGMFSIAQTSDGFLWFTSASEGMYRFDGVRLLPWTFTVDGKTIDHVVSFHADSAGGLWARGKHEIFYQKGGAVTAHFPLEANARAGNVKVDPDGSLWVLQLGYEIRDLLCHVTGQGVKCFGESDGLLLTPHGGEALLADGKGGFWLGGLRSVVHWREGVSDVHPIEALKSNIGDGVAALALDSEESLWVGLFAPGPGQGLGRLEGGVFKPFVVPGFDGSKLSVFAMTVDREGSLWVGTSGDGLFRIRGTSVQHYGRAEGLSGDDVKGIYEDREGNLWVTTTNGIDRFRDAAVTTFSKLEGLGMDQAMGVLASRDGTVWVANVESLDRIDKNGAVSSIRWGKGLPGDQVYAMLEDRGGNLWMGVGDGLYIFMNGRFRRIPEPDQEPIGLVQSMTEDIDGNIWASCLGKSRKLVRIRDFQIREEFSTSQIPMGRLAPDPHGGIWIGPRASDEVSLVLFRDGVQKSFPTGSAANMRANRLVVQPDGSVLAAYDDGIVGLREGQVQRMTTKNGLPCNAVHSFIEDKAKSWWLLTECGIVELPDSELQRWWGDPEAIMQTRLYDSLDGARTMSFFGSNTAALSPDGRVWFSTGSVVQMVDPSKLLQKAPPPVTYIESVTANRNEFAVSENLELPAHLRELQIDYTSPTFGIPQKVRFRYRLEPYDQDWHDAGTRRQAFYTDLPPGGYTFRVMASNADGVWNESDTKLDFSVAPAFYQTNWFRALGAFLLLALLWAGYRLRVRQLRREEKKLRAVIGGMPVMAFSVHPDGSPELVNQRWLDYAGLSADTTAGGRGWEATVHPDDVEVHLNKWRAALATGEPFENEARHSSASGEYRWFLARAVPFRDKQGKIVKWYGTLTDIEDRKRADEERERLRQLESELAHINRVSMLGELTASLAHEIRQPIAAAVTNANACMRWLTREPADLEEARAAVDRIARDGNRAAEIITRLKSFYKKGVPPRREPVDINEVVGEMLLLLRSDADRRAVAIKTDLMAELPLVQADRVQLQQVLLNLLLNSIDAMQETVGELTIKSQHGNDHVTVSVSDTGIGLPSEQTGDIFDAFFTTKAQGTGMGLAISRSIIESHGGRLWATNNAGPGATFHFRIPTESRSESVYPSE